MTQAQCHKMFPSRHKNLLCVPQRHCASICLNAAVEAWRFKDSRSKNTHGSNLKPHECGRRAGSLRLGTGVNSIITLLLEVDVVLLPVPGVGQVARVRLCLARKLGILGYVNSDVLRWCHNVWRTWWRQNKNEG